MLQLAQQLKTMGVVRARVVHGASWPQIAVMLGMDERGARLVYEDAEERWVAGDPEPWLPRGPVPGVRPWLRRIPGDGD